MPKRYIIFAIIFVICGLTTDVLSQDTGGKVMGTVVDATDNNPLPGVNIVVKGTTQGVSADAEGKFSLNVSNLQDTLIFSFVGYETQELSINGRTELDVQLHPQTISGEEMVVVGYGEQKRSDLTGSISSVSSEDLNPGETGSIQGLIEGKMPGVRVVQNTGAPGGGYSVSVRGAGSINAGTNPLWVIDGSPMPGGLRSINPDDIESIEVLKDASATAIYGSRASGGVVQVTTKDGGDNPLQVNYHGSVSINSPVNNINLLTPEEYQNVTNDIIDDGGGNPEDRVEDTGAETNWQKQIFNENAVEQNHSLSFGGNTNGLNYYVSVNAAGEEGIIKKSRFDRYGGRINLDYTGSDKFEFGTRLKLAHIKEDNINQFGVNENAGAVYSAIFFDPTAPVYNEDGTFYESDQLTINNPMAILKGEDRYTQINQFAGNIFGEYSILSNLEARLNVGFDVGNSRDDVYIGRQTIRGSARGGIATINENQDVNHFIEGTIRYSEEFGEHELNLLGGAETQQFMSSGTFMEAENFATEGTGTDNMGLGDSETYNLNSNRASHRLLSAFGRLNYTFQDKYLLTTTFRADGSTRFGEENKFGYFPSFALAWQMGEENFMQEFDFISELKPRISWGQTGNQSIGNLLSATTFSRGGTAIWDNAQRVGLTPSRLANPDIKWETSQQFDIGVDLSLFEDRIVANFDYFQQKTFDMLMNMPLPRETGFNNQIQNVGSISNEGFELELETRNISHQQLQWTTNLSFATINNEVTDLGDIDEIITGGSGFTNNFFLIREGLPLRSYYGYEVEGIWQTDDDFSTTEASVEPGDIKYVDQNNDGEITSDDRVDLGNSYPDFSISLSNTISYRNFQLDIFLEGSQGVKMLNNNLVDTYFPLQNRRNKYAEPYLNRWTEDNPSDKYPSFVNPGSQGQNVVNSLTVEDASYLRLKNVQLTYSFSPELLDGRLRSAQIYVTGTNLKTWSNYSGFDPALNSFGGDPNARIDYNAYPLARKFQIGARLGF